MAQIPPPPPPGYTLDSQVPPPPPGYALDGQANQPSVNDYVKAGVTGLSQGMTFGYMDEIAAGINSALGKGDYGPLVQSYRDYDRKNLERMPVTSMVSRLIGAIASPATKLIGAGVNAVRAPGYINMGMQGAAGGALAGSGESTEGNRLAGALEGGAIGGALGVAAPAALNYGVKAAGAAADRFTAPETAFSRRLAQALARDNVSVDEAAQRVADLGNEGTIADLGRNTLGLARANATQPGKSLTAAEDLVASRRQGRSDRIVQAALDAAGVAHVDEAIAKRSVFAQPLYEAAFAPQTGPITTKSKQITSPVIERLLEQPEVQKGIQNGMASLRRQYAITGETIDPMDYALARNPDTGQFERVGTPTLRLLDAAKRGLDLMLQSGDDGIRNSKTNLLTQKGHEIDAMRRTLVNQLDDLSPKDPQTGQSLYKMAREAWGGPTETIEALTHVQKVADSARDGSDITGRLFGSKAARDKLKGLFPDAQSMATFAQKISAEKTMADTERKLVGGSQTQYLRAAQADSANGGIADAAFNVAASGSPLSTAIYEGARAAKNWLLAPPKSIADEATALYSTDPATKDAAFNALRMRVGGQNLLNRALQPYAGGNLLSARVGGYSGGLLGSNQ